MLEKCRARKLGRKPIGMLLAQLLQLFRMRTAVLRPNAQSTDEQDN
jgi:hypothetical protein